VGNMADKRPMLVDPRCRELAEYFLEDVPGATKEDIVAVGEAIQSAIEGELQAIEGRLGRG
jgi:hypothetical protein